MFPTPVWKRATFMPSSRTLRSAVQCAVQCNGVWQIPDSLQCGAVTIEAQSPPLIQISSKCTVRFDLQSWVEWHWRRFAPDSARFAHLTNPRGRCKIFSSLRAFIWNFDRENRNIHSLPTTILVDVSHIVVTTDGIPNHLFPSLTSLIRRINSENRAIRLLCATFLVRMWRPFCCHNSWSIPLPEPFPFDVSIVKIGSSVGVERHFSKYGGHFVVTTFDTLTHLILPPNTSIRRLNRENRVILTLSTTFFVKMAAILL